MTADQNAASRSASIPRKRPDARVRRFRGKTMLGVAGDAYELTDSAALIWYAIDGTRTVQDLGSVLVHEYGLDRASAEADVAELVAMLCDAGLVEV